MQFAIKSRDSLDIRLILQSGYQIFGIDSKYFGEKYIFTLLTNSTFAFPVLNFVLSLFLKNNCIVHILPDILRPSR